MNQQIENVKNTRKYLLEYIDDLSIEHLNEVPAGFNNNIAWNIAHLIAAQQGLCYIRAGVELFVEEQFFLTYRAGTRPSHFIDSGEWNKIKHLFLSSIDQLVTDYQKNLFSNYNLWTTRYGVTLASIDDVLTFLLYHEGLHLGYIIALKRLVNNK